MSPNRAVDARVFGVSARFARSLHTRLHALSAQNAFAQAAFCRAPSDADIEIGTDHDVLTCNLNGRDVDVRGDTSTVTS